MVHETEFSFGEFHIGDYRFGNCNYKRYYSYRDLSEINWSIEKMRDHLINNLGYEETRRTRDRIIFTYTSNNKIKTTWTIHTCTSEVERETLRLIRNP